MPVNWRRRNSSRLTRQTESGGGLSVAVCIGEAVRPGAHGDVAVTCSGGNRGGRGSHRDI